MNLFKTNQINVILNYRNRKTKIMFLFLVYWNHPIIFNSIEIGNYTLNECENGQSLGIETHETKNI